MRLDIYIDVLVVVNIYITWLLISVTSLLSRTFSKPARRAAASLLGGLLSLAVLIPMPDKPFNITAILLKLLTCLAVTFTAYFGQSPKKLLLLSATFFASSMLLYVSTELLERFLGADVILLQNGVMYLDISPLSLILTTAAVYFVICVFSRLFSKNLGELNSCRVTFRLGCKAFSLDGFADTGNKARDLFSGLPVVICIGVELDGGEKLRAVPYKTVSGEGVLYAFLPDEIYLTDAHGKRKDIAALVAGLDPEGEKRAIFNPDILK